MPVLVHEIRTGVYADSIVLMQLQSALAGCDGVDDAGAVMGTEANLELLAGNDLLPDHELGSSANDLVLVVRAVSEESGRAALARVDALMKRDGEVAGDAYRPKSLRGALKNSSDSRWVLVSVPGEYAADVAREALAADRNVFLYSDNVTIEDEVELKKSAREKGLLVMGPDCGTALVNGVGFGFANRVRAGGIGLVAASGTGLQAIASRVHELGEGISHALGTGGRDLSSEVRGLTTLSALDHLEQDPQTRVLVLVSKPPAPDVAARVLARARATGKPTVVALAGEVPPVAKVGTLHFARSLDEAADLAVDLLRSAAQVEAAKTPHSDNRPRRFIGLFSGGTLAYEAVLGLRLLLSPLASNLSAGGVEKLDNGESSGRHLVLDLGADEFTVGRPHPMIDPSLRLERLATEAADPEVGYVLLDLVLGDGAHPDPASGLAPAIEGALKDEDLEIGVLVVGTVDDPQELEAQIEKLEQAGAKVFKTTEEAVARIMERIGTVSPPVGGELRSDDLANPSTVLNVGVELFHDSLVAQDHPVVHVEWRPPAGGDRKLQEILKRMC